MLMVFLYTSCKVTAVDCLVPTVIEMAFNQYKLFLLIDKNNYLFFCVIASLARIISKGYVNDAAVMPAKDPATNRRTGGNGLK